MGPQRCVNGLIGRQQPSIQAAQTEVRGEVWLLCDGKWGFTCTGYLAVTASIFHDCLEQLTPGSRHNEQIHVAPRNSGISYVLFFNAICY